jgi:hypothetical protein
VGEVCLLIGVSASDVAVLSHQCMDKRCDSVTAAEVLCFHLSSFLCHLVLLRQSEDQAVASLSCRWGQAGVVPAHGLAAEPARDACGES